VQSDFDLEKSRRAARRLRKPTGGLELLHRLDLACIVK
jgi:hypothetical protein